MKNLRDILAPEFTLIAIITTVATARNFIFLASTKLTFLLTMSPSGSMADVPRNLLKEIQDLERQFTVEPAKLKEITEHFVKELTKGLTVEGGSIVGFGRIES